MASVCPTQERGGGRPQRTRKLPARMADTDIVTSSTLDKRRKTSANNSDSVAKKTDSQLKKPNQNLNKANVSSKLAPLIVTLKRSHSMDDIKADEDESVQGQWSYEENEGTSEAKNHPRCAVCDLEADSFQALTTHMLLHVSSKRKSYACEKCSGEFSTKRDFIKHQKFHKSDSRAGEYVDKIEPRPEQDSQPIDTQTTAAVTPGKCRSSSELNNECVESTNQNPPNMKLPSIIHPPPRATRKIRTSNRTVEKPVPEVICTLCREIFQSSEQLNKHMDVVHPHLRPLRCSINLLPHGKMTCMSWSDLPNEEGNDDQFCCTVCYEGPYHLDLMNEHRAVAHNMSPVELNVKLIDGIPMTEDGEEDVVIDSESEETEPTYTAETNNAKTQEFASASYDMNQIEDQATYSLETDSERNLEDTDVSNISINEGSKFTHIALSENEKRNGAESDQACYACAECDLKFLTKQSLIAHVRHHSTISYNCIVCNVAFQTKAKLEKHQKEHPNLRYFCEHCGLLLWTEGELKQHTMSMHVQNTDGEFLCPECGRTFNNKQSLRRHINGVHKFKGRYQCELCERKFCFPARLREHMRIHTGEIKYECSFCEKQFIHDTTYRNHVKRHKGEKPTYTKTTSTPSLCDTCGKCFPNYRALQFHERVHEDNQLKCEYCPKRFKNVAYWKNHMRLHTTAPHMECTHCSKKFRSSSTLHEHMVTHTGETPFQCQICGFSTGTYNRLRKHQKSRHYEVKYTCPECSLQLTTYQGLFRHYLSHTKEYPYKCSFCYKVFHLEANARRHVDFHQKKELYAAVLDNLTTDYTCKDCGKTLRTFANLIIHLYLTHKFTKEKFPQLPVSLLQNRDVLSAEEMDTNLYTATVKANQGRAVNYQPELKGHDFAEAVELTATLTFTGQIEHAQVQAIPGTIDIPASFDKDALTLVASQILAMQGGNETNVVTI